MTSNEISIKTFVPGFSMGITRALVSHPFEILKIKSQLNFKKKSSSFQRFTLFFISEWY